MLKAEEAQKFWNMMNELDRETAFMMYEPGEREEKACNIERLRKTIENAVEGEDLLWIAECDNEIVGYIWAQRGNLNRVAHTAYIVTGIRSAYRNQGIGLAFFGYLDEWARKKQVMRLELTVECTNTIAIHLYEKNGFVMEGIRKKSMCVDGIYTDEYYMAKLYEA